MADLETSEKAFNSGASMITHLFNAMLQVSGACVIELNGSFLVIHYLPYSLYSFIIGVQVCLVC